MHAAGLTSFENATGKRIQLLQALISEQLSEASNGPSVPPVSRKSLKKELASAPNTMTDVCIEHANERHVTVTFTSSRHGRNSDATHRIPLLRVKVRMVTTRREALAHVRGVVACSQG